MSAKPDSHATRSSLLTRLADHPDDPSWAEFDRIYRGFLHHICLEMGLSEEDAKDVRQEVMADLVSKIAEFRYDPEKGRFRTWLRQRVRWKVLDHFKRQVARPPESLIGIEGDGPELGPRDESCEGFERLWEREWQSHLLVLAKEAVKLRVNVRSYQVFDLLYFKELSAREVAGLFGIKENHAYKIRHDVERMFQEEVERLAQELP